VFRNDPRRLLSAHGLFASRFLIPVHDPAGDGPVATRPLPAHPLRPAAPSQIAEERLDINEVRTFMEASREDGDLGVGLSAEAGVLEWVPVLLQQQAELFGSGGRPPGSPLAEKHARSMVERQEPRLGQCSGMTPERGLELSEAFQRTASVSTVAEA
jgi:hypothetical protein